MGAAQTAGFTGKNQIRQIPLSASSCVYFLYLGNGFKTAWTASSSVALLCGLQHDIKGADRCLIPRQQY